MLTHPRHPYTQGLLDSVPSRSVRGARLRQIPGMPPSVLDLPEGCAFRERCSRATEICATTPADAARGRRRTRRALSPSARTRRRVVTNATAPSKHRRRARRRWWSFRASRSDSSNRSTSRRESATCSARECARKSCTPSTASTSPSSKAKSSGSSANPAAASRRWGGSPSGSCRSPAASAAGEASRLAGLAPDAARRQQLKMQMIFQDPYASLNPRMRVVDIVGEAPVAHGLVAAEDAVGLRRAADESRRSRRVR